MSSLTANPANTVHTGTTVHTVEKVDSACFDIIHVSPIVGQQDMKERRWLIYLDPSDIEVNGISIEILLNVKQAQMLYDTCKEVFHTVCLTYSPEQLETFAKCQDKKEEDNPSETDQENTPIEIMKKKLYGHLKRLYIEPARAVKPTELQVLQSNWERWSFQQRTEHLLEQHQIPKSVFKDMQTYCREHGITWRHRR